MDIEDRGNGAAQEDTQSQGVEAGHAAGGRGVPLRSMTEQALDSYFTSLNGHAPGHLYDLVMREVEEPLFRTVLDYAEGNQSRAADILGINRGTLRKKLQTTAFPPEPALRRGTEHREHNHPASPAQRLQQGRPARLRTRAARARRRDPLHRRHGQRCCARTASTSPTCRPSPGFPRSWTAASRRCTRRSTAACSGGAAPTTR